MDFVQSIDLKIPEKLRDEDYRRQFFLAEASAHIARQLVELRKLRGLSQTALAQKIGTKQSGISRVESADYSNWSFNTLRKIAEELDARLRVVIEPAERVLHEYVETGENVRQASSVLDHASQAAGQHAGSSVLAEIGKTQNEANFSGKQPRGVAGLNSSEQRTALRA